MGNWNINISGTGPHHNQNPACDIDLMARELVGKLVASGHTVESARLHHGAAESFSPQKVSEGSATMGISPPPNLAADPGEEMKEAM